MNKFLRTALTAVAVTTTAGCVISQPQDQTFRGLDLAQNVCAECHAIRKGEAASPNSDAPTFEALANTPGMTMIALRVLLQTPHQTMPNIILEGDELAAVSQYILSQE